MKKTVFAMVALLMFSTQAVAQMGGGSMGHGMMGQGMMGEPRQQDERGYEWGPGRDNGPGEIYQPRTRKSPNGNEELKREIDEKNSELLEALRNPDTSRETITRLERDLRDLMLKLYEEAPPGY